VSGARTDAVELDQFAAAVAHEIRTPLTAVAGEIEVALRRERSNEEYRAVLQRIASGVSELVAISGDLALLGDPDAAADDAGAAALDAVVARIVERYRARQEVRVDTAGAAGVRVAGNSARLARAIALVVEHAVRYRRPDACVCVSVGAPSAASIRVDVSATPSGLWPQGVAALDAAGSATEPLRLRTARRILAASAGALVRAHTSPSHVVHIYLRRAA
jgi:signal transduction histidine kinase